MAKSRLCKIPDCGKPHSARGWCEPHYRRWLKHGNPLAGRTMRGEVPRYLREVVLNYDGDDCLPWPYTKGSNGYGQVWQHGRWEMVSRAVCEHTHGPPPTPKHDAAHSCGNGHKGCCTKRHLSWKTRSENMADMLIHGTHRRGLRHPLVKLTEINVRQIRAYEGQESRQKTSRRFDISETTVRRIQNRKRWGWFD